MDTVGGFTGYGSGFGDGLGDGDGYGSGPVLRAANLPIVKITAEIFANTGACSDGIEDIAKHFPDGAMYPRDVEKARDLGMDVSWLSKLGLFVVES